MQNNQCFDIRKNIKEGFGTFKENFSNGSDINIAPAKYLDSHHRMRDYINLQKTKKRYETPFNCCNEGYICNQMETPIVPLNSHPTLNFHHPYGPEKDLCC